IECEGVRVAAPVVFPGGVPTPEETSESDNSSVVHPMSARLNRKFDAAVPEMTGGESSTTAYAYTGPLPPSPLLLSKYIAVMLSPFETWRTPSPGFGGPSARGIEPAKTAVELPVSVKVTSSGVDSVLELMLTWTVSVPVGLGCDSPGLKPMYWFPLYVVPSGAVTVRSRSLTRQGAQFAVPG